MTYIGIFLFFAGTFPYDFSVLATIRPEQGTEAYLFTIYNNIGQEQVAVWVGQNVTFMCRENAELPVLAEVSFPVAVNDGKYVQHDSNESLTIFITESY